jgi:hypothetical protein
MADFEKDFMTGIKNPLFRFLYGLIRFRLKEVLAVLLTFVISANLMDINIKELIGKIIDKLF